MASAGGDLRGDATTAAARHLIELLDDGQREAACWPFPSDDERRLWFFTPTDHGGLPLADMSPRQYRATMQLLASVLSAPGYVTASLIIGQENVLDHLEGFRVDFGRARGRDPLLYWVRIFGEPDQRTWSWRFGGHHLSLHVTVHDGRIVSTTPCFMGADPAAAPLLGPHLHRPLGGAEDLGRELARSLDASQREAALRPVPPVDIVGANRSRVDDGDRPLPLPLVWRGRFEAQLDARLHSMQTDAEASLGLTAAHLDDLAFHHRPAGVAGRDLGPDQRELLVETIGVYVGRIADGLADPVLARLTAGIEELHFLWAGSLEPGDPHYYRIQGLDQLIEYDNAQRGGNHVHTVWRDLTADFGGDPLAAHYVAGHAGSDHSH
ncbi:MAG: DUF3500 domain-containing protein [Actinomycetota bacterium]